MAGIDVSKYKLDRQSKKPAKGKSKDLLEVLNKDISLFGNQLSDKKKERFYSELNLLFVSGIDIKSALEHIEQESKSKKDKAIFQSIKEEVVEGQSLSEAIKKTGKFSTYEFYSLQIGEESGQLSEVFKELAIYFSKKIKQRRIVVSALSYPAIVMFFALGAVWFMLQFMVPMFADVFKRFGGELPDITQFIIDLSDWLSANVYYVLGGIFAIIIFIMTQKKNDWFRKISSSAILALPFFGGIFRKIYLARFCQSMNLLLLADVPLIRAIDLVKQMVGFYPLETSLEKVKDDIMLGKNLNTSLSRFNIFPRRLVALIKVGEEVNELDQIFGKLAQQYGDEVEYQTGMLGTLIEPIMIVFLGLIVGVILISMYLPLFQLSTSVM